MRKFQFRLQALLDTAGQQERGVQHEMVRAESIAANTRMQLDALISTSAEWESEIREHQQGMLDSMKLRSQLHALNALHHRIAQQRQAVGVAEEAVAEVRERLTDAAKRRKSLENLRERSEEDYVKEYNIKETKITDDMVATRMATRRNADARETAITGVES